SCLGNIGVKKPTSVAPLLRYFDLNDPKGPNKLVDELRIELIIALGKTEVDAKAAIPKLLDLIKVPKSNRVITDEAAITLGKIGAREELEELLQSAENRLVFAGLMGLSGMRSEKDIAEMLQKLPEKNEKQISSALVSNVKKRGSETAPFLVAALGFAKNEL